MTVSLTADGIGKRPAIAPDAADPETSLYRFSTQEIQRCITTIHLCKQTGNLRPLSKLIRRMKRIPILLFSFRPTFSLQENRLSLVSSRLGRLFTSKIRSHPSNVPPVITASATIMIPSPPLQYANPSIHFDLSELDKLTVELEERRQKGYDLSRKIHVALVQARRAVESNEPNHPVFAELDSYAEAVAEQQSQERDPRSANLSHRMEEIARIKAFQFFLQTGRLLPPSALPLITDEEYLAGACMGLAQDLQRYGLGRATVRDVDSVTAACDLVRSILNYLLSFDFRNGPLRRKYDGTKYALKALETFLYELAVTRSNVQDGPEAKRLRVDDSSLLPSQELEAVRVRMEHRDELRESLIKKCRDGQKAAKQAIFALHRGDTERALQLLSDCNDCIKKELIPIVEKEPPLKSGSFGGVLEEYVEGKLFACWLYGVQLQSLEGGATGTILKPCDFDIHLEPEAYLGGLCDLTGEVGRYAVQRGTMRDEEGVRLCLQTNRNIQTSIESMERAPLAISKKMEQVNRSVEKIERMLYEMSLSSAVGRNVTSEVNESDMQEADDEK